MIMIVSKTILADCRKILTICHHEVAVATEGSAFVRTR